MFPEQVWYEHSLKWVEDRYEAAQSAVAEKLRNCLRDFQHRSGKWDLESMKLALTEFMT